MKTLEVVKLEYTLLVLKVNEGNREKTCKSLGISLKTLGTYLKQVNNNPCLKAFYNSIDITDTSKFESLIFPSNIERIEYKNKFPNRFSD